MITTMQSQHAWVKHTVTPVSVVPDVEDDAKVVVIEDPAEAEAAEARSVYGCDKCGLPLAGNSDSSCPGLVE